MKVTLIPKSHGWMLMRIEVDTVCTEIILSGALPPFQEMYTWLGRIRDRQLPAKMMIDEEGTGAYLIAEELASTKISFSIEAWKHNSPYDTYLKAIVEPNILIQSFHNEIVSCTEKQTDESEPCFIIRDRDLNWNGLLKQPNKPQDWAKRLAIYGGGRRRYQETNLDNFSLTEREKYLIELEKGIRKISGLAFRRRTKELGELVSLYQELAIDIALDAIDSDWYEAQKEKINAEYQIDKFLQGKTYKERVKEHKQKVKLRGARLENLKIGQVVDGTVIGIRDYGLFVDIGGINALLHISYISELTVKDPEQVFNLGDWIRAKIVNLDREKGRVSLSTKDLEQKPGQMLTEPWVVYQNAITDNL